MSLLINITVISGRLTADPDIRQAGNGLQVAHLKLAHNRKFRTKAGEKKESTTFIDVDAWGKQVDFIANSIRKGDEVLVHGSIEMDQWETDGQKRSKLKINARSVQIGYGAGQPGTQQNNGPQAGGGGSDYDNSMPPGGGGELSDEPPF